MRQRAVLAQHAVRDRAPKDHRGVVEHAHRHRGVDGGLELEEQHEVEPALAAEPDAPDEVAVALAQVLADEGGGQGGQRVEVERVAPAPGGEAVEQVADHARARKQQLVGGVVHGRSRRRPASRVRGVRGVRRPRRIAGGRPPTGCPGARKGPTRERPAGTGERTPTEGRRRRNCDAGRPRPSQRPPPLSRSRIGAVSRRVHQESWASPGKAGCRLVYGRPHQWKGVFVGLAPSCSRGFGARTARGAVIQQMMSCTRPLRTAPTFEKRRPRGRGGAHRLTGRRPAAGGRRHRRRGRPRAGRRAGAAVAQDRFTEREAGAELRTPTRQRCIILPMAIQVRRQS